MLLLGIDFEASGKEPQTHRILEVGACLYDWDAKIPVRILSELVDPGMDDPSIDPFPVPAEITEITGITQSQIERWGHSQKDVLAQLVTLSDEADYIVAHFGNDYDKPLLTASCERSGVRMPQHHWLDTSCDIKWPESITTRKLRYLAAESGFLNPFSHRAVFDVLTMFKAMEPYSLDAIIARSHEPMVYVQARVNYDNNQKAKDFSFRWAPGPKMWWKGQKQSDFEEEKGRYQFDFAILKGAPE